MLDKVMAAHCSKSTKSNDWSLSRIQALTLDALAPLTNILELFNSGAEEIPSDQVAKAVESAVTLLGNASCHISSLKRTKVLKEYNKDLIIWGQDRKAESSKQPHSYSGQNSPRMPPLTWSRWLLFGRPGIPHHPCWFFGEASYQDCQEGSTTSGASQLQQ